MKLVIKCLGIGVIMLVLLILFHLPLPPAARQTSSTTVPMPYAVKGDKLGMTLADYQQVHPKACAAADKKQREILCIDDISYAGTKTDEVATFFDQQLYNIHLNFDREDSSQVLTGLKEKYGEPTANHIEGDTTYIWRNGISSISFSISDKLSFSPLSFTLEGLQEKALAEHERIRAAARKSDM